MCGKKRTNARDSLGLQRCPVTLVLLDKLEYTGQTALAKIADKLLHVRESILEVAVAKSAMLKMLLLSVFFQLLGVVIIYIVGRALEIQLAFGYYCIYVPLITAIAVLPVSVLGIGIREGAFVFFFTQAGVPKAAALSLSLLLFSQSLLMAAMGGIWYLLDKTKLQTIGLAVQQKFLSATEYSNARKE